MQQDGSAPQGLQAPCDGHAQAVECLYEICNLIFLVPIAKATVKTTT
jgi:hypothetical protein